MQSTILSQLKRVFLYIVILVSFAACGSQVAQTQSNGNGLSSTATTTPTTMKNTPQTNPIVTAGQVTVVTNTARYEVKDSITVTILNGLSQPIFVSLYHTNCTSIILEKGSGTTWATQGNCLKIQGAPNAFMQLKPGSVTSEQLHPFSNTLGANSDVWQAGSYRATISYTTTFDPDSLQGGQFVHSSVFTIG